MIGCRWILLGLLATLAMASHMAAAAPQDADLTDDWSQPNPEIDDDDYVTEDELTEEELKEIADEIAENIKEDGGVARGFKKGLKSVGKGLKKGSSKVGTAMLSAGKKVVKVSGKGIKKVGKGVKKVGTSAGKGLKKVGKATGKGLKKVGKATGKGMKKVGIAAGKGMKKVGVAAGKGMKKVGKGALKAGKKFKAVATAKGKLIWGGLKEKMNGELAQAGKQLLKTVGKEILEQGASLAVEAITPMVIEYVMDKTQDSFCNCDGVNCTCCLQPPGFEKGCLEIRVRPALKIMHVAVTYNGRELAKTDINNEDGGPACTKLTGIARFIKACVVSEGIGEIDGGIRGCLVIDVEPLSLQRSICIDFKGNKKNGKGNFVPFADLDDVALGGSDDEEYDDDDDEEDDDEEGDDAEAGDDAEDDDEEDDDEEDGDDDEEEGDEGEEEGDDEE